MLSLESDKTIVVGLALFNYKFDFTSDFHINFHIDVESENDNGFSFLISPLENIGYYASNLGVTGNKNSLYINRKFWNTTWLPGVH